MPKLIPQAEFDELTALATALLARAREITDGNAPATEVEALGAAVGECQAFDLATMALANASPLMPAEMFVAMGGAVGVILAQQMDSHARLWGLMRNQVRSAYNEIVEEQRPKGSC